MAATRDNGFAKEEGKGFKLFVNKGSKHSMHRKDGMEGDGDEKGKVKYEGDGYHDLGSKPEVAAEPSKGKAYYPSVHLDAENFPELARAGVGSEVELRVKAKIVGASTRDDKHSFDLELREAALED